MRRLGMIVFLLILVAFGTYYLVVQRVDLNLYYAPTPFQFPQPRNPNPLSSITPGPAFHSEFSEGPAPVLSPRPLSQRGVFHPSTGVGKVTPPPILAPTSPPMTPLPAPTYEAVNPPSFVRTPPPILAPEITSHVLPEASPSGRLTPFGESPSPHDDRPSPSPTPSPRAEPSSSASPTAQPRA